MKKELIYLAAFGSFAFTSCVQNEDLFSNDADKEHGDQIAESIIKNMAPTKSIEVPVKEGFVTEVYCGEHLIATTNYATRVQVPANAASDSQTKSGGLINFKYVASSGATTKIGDATLYQNICFEDSREEEKNDYNDLVISTQITQKENQIILKVKPVALGSTKSIALGYVILDGEGKEAERKIISENVRTDLFKAEPVKFCKEYTNKNVFIKGERKVVVEKGDGIKDTLSYVLYNGESIWDVENRDENKDLLTANIQNDKQKIGYVINPFIHTVASDYYKYIVDEDGKLTDQKEPTPYKTAYNKSVYTDITEFKIKKKDADLNYSIVFFIRVDKKDAVEGQTGGTFTTLYAIPSNHAFVADQGEDNFFSVFSRPLGFAVAGATADICQFNYPRENQSITDVYSNFAGWVNGTFTGDFYKNPADLTYFDACGTHAISVPEDKEINLFAW
ncbi:MAG: hypothetical protein ACRCSQ_04875 [Bacteroidales bacterium]